MSDETPMETTTTTTTTTEVENSSSSSVLLLEATLQEALKDVASKNYDTAVGYFEDSTKNPNNELLDYLIAKLFTTTSSGTTTTTTTDGDNNNNEVDPYLHLVVLLVQRKSSLSPKNWMIPISKSLLKFLQTNNNSNNGVVISSSRSSSTLLLKVWIEQMIMTDSSLIHENLLNALLILLKQKTQQDLSSSSTSTLLLVLLYNQILEELSSNWKITLQSKSTSISSVRCAQVFIQIWSTTALLSTDQPQTATTISSMATGLLLPMMVNGDNDPLLQIAVLDMVLQELQQQQQQQQDDNVMDTDDSSSSNQQQPYDIKLFLAENLPWEKLLLSKESFEFASCVALASKVFDSLSNQNQSYLLKHAILEEICCGSNPTTNETDRLLVCHSFFDIFGSSEKYVHVLETNLTLRKCWWGDISRIHVPKLQAAVLISFSKFLDSTNKIMKAYTWLGMDNSNVNTTEWIYEKFVKSPLPELRIAAYTIWISLLKNVPNGVVVLTQTTTIPTLMEWIQKRETTNDARMAKFEVLTAMNSSSSTSTIGDPKCITILKKQIDLGPHGMEPMSWDTMMVE